MLNDPKESQLQVTGNHKGFHWIPNSCVQFPRQCCEQNIFGQNSAILKHPWKRAETVFCFCIKVDHLDRRFKTEHLDHRLKVAP